MQFAKIFAIFLCFLPVIIFGYGAGAADCIHPRSPMPITPADATNGGYELNGVPPSYVAGMSYQITMNTTTANTFKGGIVYAMDDTGYRCGTWTPNGVLTQTTEMSSAGACTPGDPGNSVTHTQTLANTPVNSVLLGTWTAPTPARGDLMFQGVCVQQYSTWYFLTPITSTGVRLTSGVPSVGGTTGAAVAGTVTGTVATAHSNGDTLPTGTALIIPLVIIGAAIVTAMLVLVIFLEKKNRS